MEQETIEQEFLNTPSKYLFSITRRNEEIEEGCKIYDVKIYERDFEFELIDCAYAKKIGKFTMGDFDECFFENLKMGIERTLNKLELLTLANGE